MFWLIDQEDYSTRLVTSFRVRDRFILISTNNSPDSIVVFDSNEIAVEIYQILNAYVIFNVPVYITISGKAENGYYSKALFEVKKCKPLKESNNKTEDLKKVN